MLVFLEEKQSSFAGFLRTQPWENVLLIVEDWLLRIHKYALNLKKNWSKQTDFVDFSNSQSSGLDIVTGLLKDYSS